MHVDLVIPVKGLRLGKSRLRGALGAGDAGHAELVLALAADTASAAAQAHNVRRVLAVTPDPALADALRSEHVEVLAEVPPAGLNSALRQGFSVLRRRDVSAVIGALQSDLPALRPADLAVAIATAAGARCFCPDRHGSGTTLLLSAAGGSLDPAFGPGSAAAHARSGAVALTAAPSLRCDVDTAEDLAAAAAIGLGPRTAALIGTGCR
ncbi:MAG: 2-phospho-L-lactate guanylyltransferase [Sciscionella sp.]